MEGQENILFTLDHMIFSAYFRNQEGKEFKADDAVLPCLQQKDAAFLGCMQPGTYYKIKSKLILSNYTCYLRFL